MTEKPAGWIVIVRWPSCRHLAGGRRRTTKLGKPLAEIVESSLGDSDRRPATRAVAVCFVREPCFQFVDSAPICTPALANSGEKELAERR